MLSNDQLRDKTEDLDFILKCQNDFTYFSEEVLGYKLAQFHKDQVDEVMNERYFGIVNPIGHSKCVHGDTELVLDDSSVCKVKDIVGKRGIGTYSLDPETYKMERDVVEATVSNGIGKVFVLRTRSGRETKVTGNHPFLTQDGWRELDNLKVGNFIAVPRKIPCGSRTDISLGEARFLGYLLGDGCITDNLKAFTNVDHEIIGDFLSILYSFGGTYKRYGIDYRFSGKKDGKEYFRKWLKRLGMWGDSHTKVMPPLMFSQNKEIISEFIGAYWSCDGSVRTKRKTSIKASTVNKKIALGIQQLLLRLEIMSFIKPRKIKYLGTYRDSYDVVVSGKENIRAFNDRVKLVGRKRGELVDLVKVMEGKVPNTNIDIVPFKFISGKDTKALNTDLHGLSFACKYGVSRKKCNEFSQRIHSKKLDYLATSDVLWDRVESITFFEDCETFDLQVRKNHNFLSDSFFSHNTTVFSVCYPTWRMWKERNFEICLTASSLDQSKKIMDIVQSHIEQNPFLSSLCPAGKDSLWNRFETRTANGNYYYVKPFNSTIRGVHPNLYICDDILRETDTPMQEIKDLFWTIIFGRVQTKKGQLGVVGTPQSNDDLFEDIRKKSGTNGPWKYIVKPAVEINAQGEWVKPLWPEKFTLDELKQIYETMGPFRFSREYMCNPMAGGSSLYKQSDVIACCDDTLGFRTTVDFSKGHVFIGVDFAMSSSATGDYSVFTVVQKLNEPYTRNKVTAEGIKYAEKVKDAVQILKIERHKGMPFDAQIQRIVDLNAEFKPQKIIVDATNFGAAFYQELQRKMIPVDGQMLPSTARSSILINLSKFIEISGGGNRRLVIPTSQEDGFAYKNAERLILELAAMEETDTRSGTMRTFKSSIDHDDMVFSLALALRDIEKGRPLIGKMIWTEEDLLEEERKKYLKIQT